MKPRNPSPDPRGVSNFARILKERLEAAASPAPSVSSSAPTSTPSQPGTPTETNVQRILKEQEEEAKRPKSINHDRSPVIPASQANASLSIGAATETEVQRILREQEKDARLAAKQLALVSQAGTPPPEIINPIRPKPKVFVRFAIAVLIVVIAFASFYMTGMSDAVGGQKLRAFFGSVDARIALAWRYRLGRGVPLDFSKAANLFEKAAKSGSAKAQFDIGILYYYGLGVPAQSDTASNWFDRAALQNYGPAVTMLGLIAMEDGQESSQAVQKPYTLSGYLRQDERNLQKAIDLWRRAVSLKDPFAEYLLGTAYLDLASGLRQSQPEETSLADLREKEHNLIRALFWFEMAKHDGVNPVGGMLQNVWATVPDEAFVRVMDKVEFSLKKGIEP